METEVIEQKSTRHRDAENMQAESIWLKAAVVGGLWAAIEIILGSFLHNMRIPFAGSILTFIGVSLLISFHRMWPEKGLVWRAGLICALMKSISPSSVILGPMSGIFFEALLLELGLRIFNSNLAGYYFGAVLAMISTLVHKIISLLILYGFDIITIYTNIYFFLARQLKVEDANLWMLLWIVLGIYIFLGILASVMGLAVGKYSKAKLPEMKAEFHFSEEKDFFRISPGQNFRIYLMILHLLAIPAGLLVINYLNFLSGVLFILIYLGLCIYYYRNSMRRLKKPVFWFQLFMITLLAAIFWGGFNAEDGILNYEGLLVGLEMNLRAIFIVIGFSSLSVELRNPRIKDFLVKRGFGKVYYALSLSFSALPVMVRNMPGPRQFFKNPVKWFALINRHACEWQKVFRNH